MMKVVMIIKFELTIHKIVSRGFSVSCLNDVHRALEAFYETGICSQAAEAGIGVTCLLRS